MCLLMPFLGVKKLRINCSVHMPSVAMLAAYIKCDIQLVYTLKKEKKKKKLHITTTFMKKWVFYDF